MRKVFRSAAAIYLAIVAVSALSCKKQVEVLKEEPEPRELVLIRHDPWNKEPPQMEIVDVTGWKEGKDAVILFDRGVDMMFMIPYPWHGEDTIIYSYDGDYLWVRTKPEDRSFYLFSMDCSGAREDYYIWEKGELGDTLAGYDSWVQGRVAGFCQHRWEKLEIENPEDIVCIGNLNMVDFDSLKLYPNIEAVGIVCIGLMGSHVPIQIEDLKRIPGDIDLYMSCYMSFSDARKLTRLKNLKGLFAGSSPLAFYFLRYLGKMSDLRVLDFGFMSASDHGLKHLAKLKDLHTLCIRDIKITDRGLFYLAKIRSLRSLTLERYQRHDVEDFKFWFNEYFRNWPLDNIELFPYELGSLFVPPTTPRGWRHLAELPYLRELNLQGAEVTDKDLEGIGSIVGLRRLELQGQSITDEGLRCLEGLKNLKELAIYSKSITWEGINRLQQALPECKIDHTVLYQETDDN